MLLLLANVARADERLLLLSDVETRATDVEVGVMKPFDVRLVAERDAEDAQISTVAFTLEVPEGLLLVGEEVLVESLVALGTPRTGLHLAFQCVESQQIPVFHFRLVATRPLEQAELRLRPDTRTNFLGIVACKDENFVKWECEPATFAVTAK
ncbi:MAG: hypothetical protein JSW67_15285 [Candidatus Latescibacterota bacterium]|nr:MAG: hypothetical protein JSW67_15285 [Candidatus Latescibacterota bacterium]